MLSAILATSLLVGSQYTSVQAHDEVGTYGWGCPPYYSYEGSYTIVGWQPTYGYDIYGNFIIYYRPIYGWSQTWVYHHHWSDPYCGYSYP